MRRSDLEDKTGSLVGNTDTFSRNTHSHLMQVFETLRKLMAPFDPPKRPTGS